jgi:hypothetical protein
MSPILEARLRSFFPRFSMPSCACGDGWYLVVLKALIELDRISGDQPTRITDIKSKYGSLRIYIDAARFSDESLDEWEMTFESESVFTCDVCGSSCVESTDGAWIQTRCDLHRA